MPTRVYNHEDLAMVRQVLDSGTLSSLAGGEMTPRFEREFAAAMGARYGVAMNCAMSVLHSSLIAADAGPGQEVICDPVMVFGAVAVMYNCAVPVFVDVGPVTLNMDPDLIEEKITERTKAIVVTHCFGLMAEMDRICEVAQRHGLLVIEDCAQAIFAEYKGRCAGTWGDVGSFSFQMSKQLALGDAGMAVMDDEGLRDALALHAGAPTFKSIAEDLHYNYRITEQTAAIGIVQLARTPGYIAGLRANAKHFDEAVEGCDWLRVQGHPQAKHAYYCWVSTFCGDDLGLTQEDFERACEDVGLRLRTGYTGLTSYQHPLIKERRGYGQGFPLDNPLYGGHHNQYPDGLCPVAERMIPRIITLMTFRDEDACKRDAELLRKAIEAVNG